PAISVERLVGVGLGVDAGMAPQVEDDPRAIAREPEIAQAVQRSLRAQSQPQEYNRDQHSGGGLAPIAAPDGAVEFSRTAPQFLEQRARIGDSLGGDRSPHIPQL